LDRYNIIIPLENFPALQPPERPKAWNKGYKKGGAAHNQTSSFVSGNADGLDMGGYNKGVIMNGQSYTQRSGGPMMN